MICKLCNKNRKLIKAHVIPEKFFTPLRSGNRVPEIHSNIKDEYPKRRPIGIYDKNILCATCDNAIGIWDNYAQHLLLKEFSEKNAVLHNHKKVAYRIDEVDYEKLKLFFISLIWRASISTQPFYQRIKLGPYQDVIKKMILNCDPGPDNMFQILLSKFSDPRIKSILDPHMDRFDHVNFVRVYLSGFVAYVKVDKRECPNFMKDLYMRKNFPLLMPLRDVHGSKDGQLLKDLHKIARVKKR